MKLPVNYTKLNWKQRKEVREEYISLQKGFCYYCGKRLKDKPAAKILKFAINVSLFPENFFNYPIHLHHNHSTGQTIGAVYNYCNAVLWQYFKE